MRISIAQMQSGIDPAENCATLITIIAEAKRGGAIMLFTPEMTNIIDRDGPRALPKLHAQSADPHLSAICDAARQHQLWVHIGSMAFLSEADHRMRVNRGLVINARGQIWARYDKMHLFDVDLAMGEQWRESASYTAGNDVTVTASPVGLLGLSICYDLRFPVLYQMLSAAGASVIAVPAAFTVPTGKAHWETLLRARAIENASWVIAAAQTGIHDDGRSTYGHSLVIDPWGRVVLDLGEGVALGFAELDPSIVIDVRARIPVIAHRRAIPAAKVVQ